MSSLSEAQGLRMRAAEPRDKSAIMGILRDTPEFLPAEVTVAEEVLDCYLKDPERSGYQVVVAEIGLRVVGYASYGPTPLTGSTWDIYWIATARQMRDRGIWKALMGQAEKDIAGAGGDLVVVETSSKPDYANTRAFYQARGYEILCRIPDFYAPGDDLVTFGKRLRTGHLPG